MSSPLKDHDLVYEPHTLANSAGWRATFRDLWQARGLTLTLLQRDLRARHRQSILGWLWAILPSVGTTILFVFLKSHNFVQIREPQTIPYAPYVLFMFSIWQIFAVGVVAATNSLVGSGYFLTKVNFSRESLVLASFGSVLFDFILRTILVVGVFIWFHVTIVWTAVLLPLILLPLVLLVIGLGFFLSIMNALIRDIGNTLTVIIGFLFFLVPVIYPPPQTATQAFMNDLNPISAILIASHDVMVLGYLTRPAGFMIACLASVLVYAAGWKLFRMAQPIVAERI